MDERQGGYSSLGNLFKVQQPCNDVTPVFLFNDRERVTFNYTSGLQDVRIGRRLPPRVNIEGIPGNPLMDRTPSMKVSKNLKPVAAENDVVDLTLPTMETPANIPNLTILDPTEVDLEKTKAGKPSETPTVPQVEIAEPYKEIRKKENVSGGSRVCQEVSWDQFGINLRVPNCNLQQEFPGVNFTQWSPDAEDSFDPFKYILKTQKPVTSKFQEGKVIRGKPEALNQMMAQHKLLVTGTHGVITTEALNPTVTGRYTEGQMGEFYVQESLGEGGFGKVQLCVDKMSQKKFVRKEVFSAFKNTEVLLLSQINHDNITKLYGFIQRNGVPEIIMEYAGTNLLKFTLLPPTNNLLNEDMIQDFTKQGLSALAYLDNRGIIHLDVKPENFCVLHNEDNSYTLKLTDFGSSKTPQDELTYSGWTAEYMSPEACFSFLQNRFPQKFNENPGFYMSGKTDVFSFGLTIIFLYIKNHVLMKFFTNGSSYKEVDRKQTQLQILIALAQKPDIVHTLMLPDNCCPQMKEFLAYLLEGVPEKRMSAHQAIIYLNDIKKREILALHMKSKALALQMKSNADQQIAENAQSKGKAKRVKGSRKSSARESQSSRYSTEMMVSSGSLMDSFKVASISNNCCPASPGNPDSPGGPVRCRSVKTKLRERLSCPYHTSQKVQDNVISMLPSTSDDIKGNFPNFAILNKID